MLKNVHLKYMTIMYVYHKAWSSNNYGVLNYVYIYIYTYFFRYFFYVKYQIIQFLNILKGFTHNHYYIFKKYYTMF